MSELKLAHPPVDCISKVRFAPFEGSKHLIASSWDASVRLYDVDSTNPPGLHKCKLAVLDCTFTSDVGKCISGGLEQKVILYDFRAQKETCLGKHDEAVKCLEFHEQSQQVFSASWDRTLRAWDVRKPATAHAVHRLGAKAFSMDVCRDKVIIAGSDRRIHIFDVRKLECPLETRDNILKTQLRCVKVGVSQRCFAYGAVDGRVALDYFEPEEQKMGYAFKCHRVREADEERVHPVNAIAFHPVHGTFATGGSDGGVCVWDGHAQKRLLKIKPFHTSVSSLGFSADGSQLAVAVSYSFDEGEQMPTPVPQLVVKNITEKEVRPKAQKDV